MDEYLDQLLEISKIQLEAQKQQDRKINSLINLVNTLTDKMELLEERANELHQIEYAAIIMYTYLETGNGDVGEAKNIVKDLIAEKIPDYNLSTAHISC